MGRRSSDSCSEVQKRSEPGTYSVKVLRADGQFSSYAIFQFNSSGGLSIIDSRELIRAPPREILFTTTSGSWKKVRSKHGKKKFEALTINFQSALNQDKDTGLTVRIVFKGKFNHDLTKIKGKLGANIFNSPEDAISNKRPPVLDQKFEGYLLPSSLNHSKQDSIHLFSQLI